MLSGYCINKRQSDSPLCLQETNFHRVPSSDENPLNMVQTLSLNCPFLAAEPSGLSLPSKSRTTLCCSASRNNAYIPKLEPFSRSKIDRAFKEPPLVQKSENQIADYCSTLDGDDSYGCWKAYFELKDLEKEVPKEELERLIIEAGGVKSLISCVHGVAAIYRAKKGCCSDPQKAATNANEEDKCKESQPNRSTCPIPDGLPKTWKELQEEEEFKMPDSPFTRLLRARGRHPAWYSPVPEHETD